MQSLRKFWGRVTSGRWKVVDSQTGEVAFSYWTRSSAQDVSSAMNETAMYLGLKSRFQVRWM